MSNMNPSVQDCLYNARVMHGLTKEHEKQR
jgi:hypothetical protein